jgi:hypothetical protein
MILFGGEVKVSNELPLMGAGLFGNNSGYFDPSVHIQEREVCDSSRI